MTTERLIPGGPLLNEQTARQAQIPGGPFVNETVAGGGGDTTPPTLGGSITIGTVTSTSIQMSWSAGADDTAVTSYEVSSNSGGSYSDAGLVLTYTFTGLTPSTSYGLRVRANDAAANVSTPALQATQSTSAASGTFTSEPLKDNTGALVVSQALTHFTLYDNTTGALVVRKTGLSTDAAGVVSFTDAALVAATNYRADWLSAAGHYRMPVKAAT